MDIGETSYAMVLADDLDGNGYLDLLMATMNGNLYAFQTAALYHPDAVWPSQVQPFSPAIHSVIDRPRGSESNARPCTLACLPGCQILLYRPPWDFPEAHLSDSNLEFEL